MESHRRAIDAQALSSYEGPEFPRVVADSTPNSCLVEVYRFQIIKYIVVNKIRM